MKKALAALMCAAMLMGGTLPALADEAVPPTVEEAPVYEPREQFYIESGEKHYAEGYSDPTLEIHITDGEYLGTTWMAARIRVAYPTQLRTYMAGGRYGKIYRKNFLFLNSLRQPYIILIAQKDQISGTGFQRFIKIYPEA